MPRPYQPPLSRRPQAVDSAERPSPPRSRWLWVAVPLLVLGPVVAVVLATEWQVGRQAGETLVAQPTALPTLGVSEAVPTATAILSNSAGPGQPVGTGVTAVPSPTTAAAVAAATPAQASTPTSGAQTTAPASTPTSGAQTAAPTEASASGPFRAYRVQPGDTVRFVSEMFGVSPASVINASGLANPDQIRVGQVLTIPSSPGYLYRVQAGETLDQIAARTGRSLDSIATASKLAAASVRAGDVVLIPDVAAAQAK